MDTLMEIFSHPPESEVRRLLADSGLTTADLGDHLLPHFFGCGLRDALTGVVGIEPFGEIALLRSLAVAAPHRRAGLGSRLVARAEHYAAGLGVRSLYLLTLTAEKFFRRRGYLRIDRNDAPPAIRATREFSDLCPSNSTLMVKPLTG
jgi:amino-acid N-acetyltransferase